jgi:hypothetical protein
LVKCILFLNNMAVSIPALHRHCKYVAQASQIIADHTVVARYDDIPQAWIDEVKKMWVTFPGESHSEDAQMGMLALEASNATFAVSSPVSGNPEAYTDTNLRYSTVTWGDLDNATGWIYDDCGEEDWFVSAPAIAHTKVGLSYCNTGGLTLNATGFSWCWDYITDDGSDTDAYLAATQDYISYCTTNSLPTKIFFSTSPSAAGGILPPSYNYILYLRNEEIRDYVKANNTRVLFDYGDILAYNDAGVLTTESDGTHTYPAYNTDNDGGAAQVHIGSVGGIRLAKAMWWMLARMAGWDGN